METLCFCIYMVYTMYFDYHVCSTSCSIVNVAAIYTLSVSAALSASGNVSRHEAV